MKPTNGRVARDANGFTPTQARIMAVLCDGAAHTYHDLVGCLWDEACLDPKASLATHISYIRKIIRPRGEEISCTLLGGVGYYRHVRTLSSAYDGVR